MFDSIQALAQNLYQNESTTSSAISSIATKSNQITQASSNNSDLFLTIISNFNYFVLAWSMFYSALLFMNFYYWRLYRTADRLHHEAKGVKAIQDAWWIWFRYIHVLLLLTLAVDYKNFGILVFGLLFYFARMFVHKTYTNFANSLLVIELLAVVVAIFTIRTDLTIMRSVFAMLFVINVFLVKLRFDFVVIMESLSQGFGQIGWKDNWPASASKFAGKFTIKDIQNSKLSTFLFLIYAIAFVVIGLSLIITGLS